MFVSNRTMSRLERGTRQRFTYIERDVVEKVAVLAGEEVGDHVGVLEGGVDVRLKCAPAGKRSRVAEVDARVACVVSIVLSTCVDKNGMFYLLFEYLAFRLTDDCKRNGRT